MHPTCFAQDVVPSTVVDGFDVLDPCHRQTVFALSKLAAVVTALRCGDDDAEVCTLAGEVVDHFEHTSRHHHEEEELWLFPQLLERGDGPASAAIQRLRQDHRWIERNWRELGPMVDAVANGLHWVDLDALQEASEVFTSLSLDHIALEEGCIYPQVRTRLPDRSTRDLFRDMGLLPPAGVAIPVEGFPG